jgi:hypothetical protein
VNSVEYHQELRDLLREATAYKSTHVLIMGDFNFPNIKWPSWTTEGDNSNSQEFKFLECVQDCVLYQHVDRPTRWRGNDTPHLLDLIRTNEEHMVKDLDIQSALGKGDHSAICFNFVCYTRVHSQPKRVKCFDKADFTTANTDIRARDLDSLLQAQSVNDVWSMFLDLIREM